MAELAYQILPAVHTVEVGNYSVFYREAGPPDAPTLLLLHGFPSSSFLFRHLIPALALTYHVVAPDFPGFGFTKIPTQFPHTFDNIADVMEGFLDALNIQEFAEYIIDYGAPVGLRLAVRRPHAVKAIVSQNGNAYVEGLGPGFDAIRTYWASGSQADRDALIPFFTLNATASQYTTGTKLPQSLEPESWWLDYALMNDQPGNTDVQLDYFFDYRNNVAQYPQYQEYFRQSQVPLLAVWGENDQFFIPAGAMAYKRDLPHAEIHLIDAGHFALVSNAKDILHYMLPFLQRNLGKGQH
ncbi:alpha/beta-hydrolase [Trichoderma citrinoviride]|uniref:Alpha/beta-hydrolase n=1 Tax=Trichoderma citrinoviride TaxID=58853 RepID=A0A2T4B5Z9_9HYPO|nr:alpha/beta-hydrolase [Trichoderma citrinoviride]PTB64767.1 alpha/beta-hydrolase [Trichoderma citrinoviride]